MVRPKRQTAGSADQGLDDGNAPFSQTLTAQHLAVMSVRIDWQTDCSNRDRAMRFVTRFQLDRQMSTTIDVQLTSRLLWLRGRTESFLSEGQVADGLMPVPGLERNSPVLAQRDL
jgi:hypothetical protein